MKIRVADLPIGELSTEKSMNTLGRAIERCVDGEAVRVPGSPKLIKIYVICQKDAP
jgi:hypothetical protein